MADRIRLYKFVTPPKEADGAQMTVGKKTFTTTGFVPTVKAINSLGATVNSIGLALKKNQEAQARIMEDQRRAAALQADRQREAAIEAEEAGADSAIRPTTATASASGSIGGSTSRCVGQRWPLWLGAPLGSGWRGPCGRRAGAKWRARRTTTCA